MEKEMKCCSITCNYCYIQIIGVHKHRCEIMILTEIHYAQLKLLSYSQQQSLPFVEHLNGESTSVQWIIALLRRSFGQQWTETLKMWKARRPCFKFKFRLNHVLPFSKPTPTQILICFSNLLSAFKNRKNLNFIFFKKVSNFLYYPFK